MLPVVIENEVFLEKVLVEVEARPEIRVDLLNQRING
jgi:hypothetical protein